MLGVALRDSGLALDELVSLATSADADGYSSIWIPEVGSRDAIGLAGLVGSRTARATVGTGVVPVYSRNVAALSLAAATAAEACGGRFALGIGAGHRFPAEAWFGSRWHDPRAHLRETVEVLRLILSGERVTHHGAFAIDGFHLGSEPPEVPVYLAALTPASLRLAGDVADGAILNWLPAAGIAKASLLVRESAADAGRTTRLLAYVRVAVVEDPDEEHHARMAMREQTYSYLSLPAYANSLRKVGYGREIDELTSGSEKVIDTLVDALCAWGDLATVKERLDEFGGSGLDEVVVYPVPYGDDPAGSIGQTLRALRP